MIIIRPPVANSKYLVYALCVLYYDAIISSQGGRTTKLAVDAKITGARSIRRALFTPSPSWSVITFLVGMRAFQMSD